MEPKQMLEAVIEKATKNGFTFQQIWTGLSKEATMEILDGDESLVFKSPTMAPSSGWPMNFSTLFFNHNFAKAYFGQEVVCADCGELVQSKGWEAWCSGSCADKFRPKASTLQWVYHLKEAVLSEDPLLYYYQHL